MILKDLVDQLTGHPLYAGMRDEGDLRHFMASHVFCVWDFQSLVKALQQALTCVEVPWFPTADPAARRLVNEIVLDEESDLNLDGAPLSHFEMYLKAMRECGADTGPIEKFTARLQAGRGREEALRQADLPPGVAEFVSTTLEIAESGETHRIAAAFAYGREEVIPALFRLLVQKLADVEPARWGQFHYYLVRHIENDAERHGPMARALVERLCGRDEEKWRQARRAARTSLQARLRLWDCIHSGLPKSTAPAQAAH